MLILKISLLRFHHGVSFSGLSVNRAYVDSEISFFDHVNADSWCYILVEELVMQLGYGLCPPNLKVYWLLPGKELSDGLRIISSDEDTLVMHSVANKRKTFLLFFL